MATGTIFNIEYSSLADGPGLRTVIFFGGCPLRCKWCHNPEGLSPKPQKLFFTEKCSHCGACRSVCPSPEACTLCGACTRVCPTGAVEICGKTVSAGELLPAITRDRAFYGADGGVTFSGGECMMQLDFLAELLGLCRKEGIHTAVDTSGYVPFEHYERILPLVDLFLYDIKAVTPSLHKACTGVDNRLILDNFERLYAAGAKILVRVPVIPEANGHMEEMRGIASYLARFPGVSAELLPYHRLGEAKYAACGHTLTEFSVPDEAYMNERRGLFRY